jgi:hypothetical protein
MTKCEISDNDNKIQQIEAQLTQRKLEKEDGSLWVAIGE